MNENVCRTCRRYCGRHELVEGWVCASVIQIRGSYVVPGFKFAGKYDRVQVKETMSPPDWCERPLEHIITKPGEEVDLIKDSILGEFDGNNRAEWHQAARTGK